MYEREPEKRLFELIAGIHIRTRRLIQDCLAPLNLTYPQYGALSVLAESPGLSQQELATALNTDTTTVMVICDGLEKKGLLSRDRDPHDRRRRLLRLSAGAGPLLKSAHAAVEALMEPVRRGLDPGSVAPGVEFLSGIYNLVSRLANEERTG